MKQRVFTPYFDRFDVQYAFCLFAVECHNGQESETYAIFHRLNKIEFKPLPCLDWDSLNDNGKQIYINAWFHFYPLEPLPVEQSEYVRSVCSTEFCSTLNLSENDNESR